MIVAFLGLMLGFVAFTPVRADVVYSYTGNPFTNFTIYGSPPESYGPTDLVTLRLVLPGPIGDD
jgi:hypothetical protein